MFNKGLLFYGTSDSVSQLGYVLIRKNVITIGELERALKVQRTEKVRHPVGTILINIGAITKKALQAELKSHLAESFAIFSAGKRDLFTLNLEKWWRMIPSWMRV
ncbi:MAG: hypothetical protein ABGX83_02075 [Nitrospira sp.]|nr:hypothetical protein [Candidatus Manganitrophaceae bacterium]HIL34501.1 hypothetical protein [Candidatus Manganitrophaceae bacterium]